MNLTVTGGGLFLTPDATRPPTPAGPEVRLVSQESGAAPLFPVGAYYAVRTDTNPETTIPAVRQVVAAVAEEGALFNVEPMTALVANNIARPKLYAVLLGAVGFSGLTLALIGIYGVMAYTVTQRTREIGIRISLGAARGRRRWMQERLVALRSE